MIGWGALCVCLPLKRSSGRRGRERGRGERWAPTLLKKHKNLEWYAEKTGELGEGRKRKPDCECTIVYQAVVMK